MTKVMQGQSLLDIALQVSGTVENVFELAQANGMAVTDELVSGTALSVPLFASVARRELSYYNTHAIKPATGFEVNIMPEGIEYWSIENDFIVK